MPDFKLVSDYKPAGGQPAAIDALVKEKFRDVNKTAFSHGYALG